MLFSLRLRELRLKNHLTQPEIAAAVGFHLSKYTGYEYGKIKPGMDALITLADFFDVSLDYLVCRSDNPSRQ